MGRKPGVSSSHRGSVPPAASDAEIERKRASLLDTVLASIDLTDPERRAPLVREARELIKDLEGSRVSALVQETGERGSTVVDFRQRLASKQSKAQGARGRRSGR